MAGFSDAPFRRLCRDFGSAWAVTEMASAKALANGDERTLDIAAPYPGEPDLVVQLFASDPGDAARASELLVERYAPQALDLNMGCPVKKVTQKGCGVELLTDPTRAASIVQAMQEASGRPVSAKLRLGVDDLRLHEVADTLIEAGVDALSVHGRTARQKYGGVADWRPILELAQRSPIPIIGSGDVRDAKRARELQAHGVGVMIGRGALGQPWIFAELLGHAALTWREAATVMLGHAALQVAHYGEARGLRALRGHLRTYVERYEEGCPLRDAVVRIERLADLEALLPASTRAPRAVGKNSAVTHAMLPRPSAGADTGGRRA